MSKKWMQYALELANRGWGRTSPNPMVGCVIVKDDIVLAEGFHAAAGLEHAERSAINQAQNRGIKLDGSSLYVNLEPCVHYGRTPPCTDLIISAGISQVFVAMTDPNPKVAGNGVAALRQAGIKVDVGLMEYEAKVLNEPFCKFITTGLPFVIMKSAMSIDGKIADSKGKSRWISGEKSRDLVHHWRDRASAIIAGSRTILLDNPSLTTRLPHSKGKNPVRVIIDSRGEIPLECRTVGENSNELVIVATASFYPQDMLEQCKNKDIRVFCLDDGTGRVDLAALINLLGSLDMDCILLEGGGSLNASFLQAGLVDKLMLFMAPILIGGKNAVSCFAGNGVKDLGSAIKVEKMLVTPCGEDWLIEGYPYYERNDLHVHGNN